MKINKKAIIVFTSNTILSMMTGYILGCIRNSKIIEECKCIIDEL